MRTDKRQGKYACTLTGIISAQVSTKSSTVALQLIQFHLPIIC